MVGGQSLQTALDRCDEKGPAPSFPPRKDYELAQESGGDECSMIHSTQGNTVSMFGGV